MVKFVTAASIAALTIGVAGAAAAGNTTASSQPLLEPAKAFQVAQQGMPKPSSDIEGEKPMGHRYPSDGKPDAATESMKDSVAKPSSDIEGKKVIGHRYPSEGKPEVVGDAGAKPGVAKPSSDIEGEKPVGGSNR